MMAALIHCLDGFDQSPSPIIHQGATYSNRSYQGAMLNAKDVPKHLCGLSPYSLLIQQECKENDTVGSSVDVLSNDKHGAQ